MVTKKSFIDGVISEVTMDVLPFNLPPKRVNKVLKKAVETWRDNDDRATLEDILFIDLSKAGNCKKIKMPEDIKAITRLELVSVTSNQIYTIENRQTFIGAHTGGDGALMTYISIGAYNELIRQMSVRFVPYDFSEYTHELILEGDPRSNIFCEVERYIPEEAMYKIDDFESYVAARLTMDYCKVNNFFGRKLVGGREINFDELKSDAEEFIKGLKEKWDDQTGNGIMMLD
jgi:hypothetical protein